MLLFDLRWLLFSLLLALMASLLLAIWLDRVLLRRRQRETLPILGEMQPVLEHAPLGLLMLGEAHSCRYTNPYARRLLGLGSSPCELPDTDWVHLLDEDRAAARKEMATVGCYRTAPVGGEQFVRWWVIARGNLDLVFLLDAAEPHRTEQATRFLLSDLSHELRTPLATLLTHLEVLRLAQIPEETRQQSVYLMQQEAKRMTRLVHNLLELGHLQTSAEIERRPVDLRKLVEEVMAQVAPEAEKRQIALSVQADTPLSFAVGDADRLRQVFLNLLENAIKYSRSGDRVTKVDPFVKTICRTK